jgi:hypothetical protein
VVLLAIFMVLGVAVVYLPGSHAPRNTPSWRLFRSAANIGSALRRYQEDHGTNLPAQLSELVPNYVAISNANWFFAPRETNLTPQLPLEKLRREIDSSGTFIYLGERGAKADMVFYQRKELWTKKTDANDVQTLTSSNLVARQRSKQDVETRLRLIEQ